MMKMFQMTHSEVTLLRTLLKIRIGHHLDLAEKAEVSDTKAMHMELATECRQMYERMGEL